MSDWYGKDLDAFAYASALNAMGMGDTSQAAFEQAAEVDLLNQLAASGAPSVVPTATQQPTVQEETQTLLDIIREAGGEVKDAAIEGTADLGNLVVQAVTLGQGPRLEAVIPNILDLIKGRLGGQLVFGGGQTPASVVGTGQTGVGAGTKVALPQPIGWIVDVLKGGIPDFGGIIRNLPGTIGQNLPTILASAAAADYDLTPSDKETLVRLGAERSLFDDEDDKQRADSDAIQRADAVDILTDGGGQPDVEVGGVTIRGGQPNVEAGGLTIRGGQPNVEAGGLTIGDFDRDIRTGTLNPYETETTRTSIAPPPEVVKYSAPASGGDGGGGGGGIAPQQGIRSIQGGPGDLVDIAGFYDISGTSIIPDYIDKLMEKRQQRQLRAAKGGHVKKFQDGGGVTDAEKLASVTMGQATGFGPTSSGGGGGGIGNFFTENAPLLLGGLAGGLLGLGGGGGSSAPMGYQGGIPEYTATREVVPGAFSDTDRRPGSSGRRYFTDVQFERGADDAVMGGDYLANLNQQYADQQAAQEADRNQLAQGLGGLLQQQYDTRQAQQAATAQAEQDYYREAAAAQRAYEQSLAQPDTTADTTTTRRRRSQTREAIESDPARQTYAEAYTPRDTTGETSDLSGLEIYQTVPGNQTPLFSDPYNDIAEIINYMESTDGISTGEAGRVLNYAINNDIPLTDIVEITQGINPDFTIEDAVTYLETYYPHHAYNYLKSQGYAAGGNVGTQGYYLGGPTDGMADQIPATIDGRQPAALSDGEFVIPADVVSHLGNGNSEAGAQNLYSMMERVRKDRTGNPNQGRQIDPNKYLA